MSTEDKHQEKDPNELIEAFWISQGGKAHMAADIHFYESDRGMLHPVLDLIDGLYIKAFPPGDEFIRRILAHEEPLDGPYMDVVAMPITTPIKEVHEAVVEFIKWYNTQPK